MYYCYPHLAVSLAAHPAFLPAARRSLLLHCHSSLLRRSRCPSVLRCSRCPSVLRRSRCPSVLRRSRCPSVPAPWRRRRAIAADGFFTDEDLDLDDYADNDDDESPWEGALIYRRDAAVHHLEFATTLERLGLGDLSSHDSRARAAAMGLGAQAQTPVLVSLDVTRRRGRLRLDGIVRTVITLGCFRCAEPAPQGIFANFSLLLTEDPVEEPDVIDLGTIYEEDIAKGTSLTETLEEDDQDVDWDDRLHFPAADKEIDISKHIRDIIHLEITMDAVCSPSCKGLCLSCGANLNTSSCSCSKDKPQERKNVKGQGPLRDLLKPIHKR